MGRPRNSISWTSSPAATAGAFAASAPSTPSGARPCSVFITEYRYGGEGYWPIDWNKLIDGVFVPDMYTGAVQLDSAGHVFKGFPRISGATYGSIVPCAGDFSREQRGYDWTKDMGLCRPLMPKGRGLLSLHANMGITFNLEAMRKLYPTTRPARFRAVAGIGDGRPWISSGRRIADFWVFVRRAAEVQPCAFRFAAGRG